MNKGEPGFCNRVICVGMTAQDHIWSLDEIPSEPVKVRANDFRQIGGGMAATAAVAVARLGGEVAFWGRAGDDVAGRVMHEELAAHGVDVTYFHLASEARSAVSGIFVDSQGERLICNFRGLNLPDKPDWLPLNSPLNAKALLVDMRWLTGALAVCRRARFEHIPIVLDADIAACEDYEKLLPWVDYPIFSAPALEAFAPKHSVEAALNKVAVLANGWAAVTQGYKGIDWLDGQVIGHEAAFTVDVVDSTGAGDVFHGAFAYALANGQSSAQAIRFAAAVAALKCTAAGGRDGIPDLETTLTFLENSK
jgi:sulfofructose kinase